MESRYADATSKPGNLGVMPGDREEDWRVAENAKVVTIVRVLPDVLAGENQIFSKGLLDSSVKLIPPARTHRSRARCRATKKRIQDGITASGAGDDQIFVERCFEQSRIGNAEDRAARLGVVEVSTQTKIECPVSFRDLVLGVQRQFLYVGVTLEEELSSSTG